MQSELHVVRVGSIHVRYQQAGSAGLPLLLLHGIGRSLEDWEHVVPILATHYRVWALDLIGCGESDAPPLPYSFELLAIFVRDFLDTVGIERAIMVGHSMGGGVALEYTLRWPQQVIALTLIGSAGFGGDVGLGLRLLTLPWIGEYLTQPSRAMLAQTQALLVHAPAALPANWLDREYQRANRPGAQQSFLHMLRSLLGWRGTAAAWMRYLPVRLDTFNTPILLIWGAEDRVLPSTHLTHALQHIPHAQGVRLSNCGHTPQLEQPQLVGETILEWLDQRAKAERSSQQL